MPPKAKSELRPKTNSERVGNLITSLHFWWFFGQCSIILCTILHTINSLFSSSRSIYDLGLISILATYGIVIGQVHFKGKQISAILKVFQSPQGRLAFLRDDNVQYFILATVIYLSKDIVGQVSGCLFPYAIYAVFHSIGYFQQQLLPVLPYSFEAKQRIDSSLTHAGAFYSERAMVLACTAEIRLFVVQLLSLAAAILTIYRNFWYTITKGIITITLFTFVVNRYAASQHMKVTIESSDAMINQYLSHPMIPPLIKHTYLTVVRPFVRRLSQFAVSLQVPAKAKSN